MSKKKNNTYPETLRLPYGQRVIIISAINNWDLPVGTRGTIARDESPVGGRLDADEFWEHWQEQLIVFDGGGERSLQTRRAHIAPINEWAPR